MWINSSTVEIKNWKISTKIIVCDNDEISDEVGDDDNSNIWSFDSLETNIKIELITVKHRFTGFRVFGLALPKGDTQCNIFCVFFGEKFFPGVLFKGLYKDISSYT